MLDSGIGTYATPLAFLGLLLVSCGLALSYRRRWSQAALALEEQVAAGKALAKGRELLDTELSRSSQELKAARALAAKADTRAVEAEGLAELGSRQLAQANARLAELTALAEQSTRSKGEFLANMSHELRTPLTTIMGMAELLRDGAFGPLTQKQSEGIRTIDTSSQHLLDLINDLLEVARLETGRVELERRSIDVRTLCHSCMAFVQEAARRKQITFNIDTGDVVERLWADQRRLRQILVNLLGNAVKFTPEGGSFGLIVRNLEGAAGVKFSVWDTGIGIERERLESIFKPFEQVDASLARKYGGTGLGLTLVQRLVQLHGGSVEVTSVPAQGSRFTFTIPDPEAARKPKLSAAPVGPAAKSGVTPPAQVPEVLKGLFVVLAEDDPTNARIIELQLQRRGCRVLVAFNGQEAIALIDREKPDLILMDIQMPVLNGIKATRLLKSAPETRMIPIICLTALAMTDDRQRCMEAGADDYLTKPIDIQALLGSIERNFKKGPLAKDGAS